MRGHTMNTTTNALARELNITTEAVYELLGQLADIDGVQAVYANCDARGPVGDEITAAAADTVRAHVAATRDEA